MRSQIKIFASGKVITAFDIAKNIALGADACYSARGMMFSLGCIQALQCDSGRCPVGIATQDKKLYKGIDITNKSVRVANYHKNTILSLLDFMGACGFVTLSDIQPNSFSEGPHTTSTKALRKFICKIKNHLIKYHKIIIQ